VVRVSEVAIRQATEADLEKLVARWSEPHERAAERDRFEDQERGESLLLIAWDGDEIVGRMGRLYLASKYPEVREQLGVFPEINGLDAWPQGRGVGSKLIAAAEDIARARGFDRMGIGVLIDNTAARRLYERLGYEYWGEVIDVTEYRNEAGDVIHVQKDPADYLVKRLT
jgi:RimJ/RimL family protein N-acetyltransferase